MNTKLVQEEQFLSTRIQHVPRSFIRDILKVAIEPDVISFAGGLPNKKYFPCQELSECTQRVFRQEHGKALQYSNSEGLLSLREKIAHLYAQDGLDVSPENILITTGSQQALDLLGKVCINKGDELIIEKPGYLGAIQAFSMYQPKFKPVPLLNDGVDTEVLQNVLKVSQPKIAYLVPNYQNPTGISYSVKKRHEVADLLNGTNTFIVEDDPYGRISFENKRAPGFYALAPKQTIMLGTFSKTVVPGFRLGWIVAPKTIYEKLLIAKQAADLHTDIFVQYIVNDFLANFDLDNHLGKIIGAYQQQAKKMIQCLRKEMPPEIQFTQPGGGMFCWVSMPKNFSSMLLFNEAIKQKVAFVPGVPFYINKSDCPSFRLNFSCSSITEIEEGISRLADAVRKQ